MGCCDVLIQYALYNVKIRVNTSISSKVYHQNLFLLPNYNLVLIDPCFFILLFLSLVPISLLSTSMSEIMQ